MSKAASKGDERRKGGWKMQDRVLRNKKDANSTASTYHSWTRTWFDSQIFCSSCWRSKVTLQKMTEHVNHSQLLVKEVKDYSNFNEIKVKKIDSTCERRKYNT